MRDLVEMLCSPACGGRKPGTREGLLARAAVVDALRAAGLDPYEQAVPGCGGANVLATLPGDDDRWVVVGAHYDHLGKQGPDVYWGADDNAAGVGILVEVARALAAKRPAGRGVVIASFDGEEPPYFLQNGMGSQHFCKHSPVPLDRIDMMVCMDLVGHAFGGEGLPDEVRQSLFALGAERSSGTAAHVDRLTHAANGVAIRRVDAEVIPPLSDYDSFWRRKIPFLFLTSGRSRFYHTPEDTPEHLDWGKMAATAAWLERFVRETAERDDAIRFGDARDDASTLRSMIELTALLEPFTPDAAMGKAMAEGLLAACDRNGALPEGRADEPRALVGLLESRLS